MNKYKTILKLSSISLLFLFLAGCAHERSEFDKGYDLGMSDTAKRQYWAIQKVQELRNSRQREKINYRNAAIPIYGRNQDGTNIAPHYVNVRVIDTRG
jgi:hypothetical protein